MSIVGVGGCGAPPSVCDEMCAEASLRFEECLEEWGQGYEDRGYDDAADFDNGCHTWVWEQTMLVHISDLEDACANRLELWRTDTCDTAIAQAWTSVTGS